MITFIKQQMVLCVAAVLGLVSMVLVPPNPQYCGYIDFRTLAILFSFMATMAGFEKIGVFSALAQALLKRAGTLRRTVCTLVFLCFFSSMLITNDVALITFVPFAIVVLSDVEDRRGLLLCVVLQTVAANLGSMATPMGNPQNLYLYSVSSLSVGTFFATVLPYAVLSGVLLLGMCYLFPKTPIPCPDAQAVTLSKPKLCRNLFLFGICLLAVAEVISYLVAFGIVLAVALIFDCDSLKRVDYSLLLTFVCFFIFVGNLKNVQAFQGWLAGILAGREILVSVLASQVISNVPAALLLSGFTNQSEALLVGTNLGGLGTLIASMASLISYQYFAKAKPQQTGKYILVFSGINVLFLLILAVLAWIV